MQRLATYLLILLIVIVLTMQARLLYIFPQPDSARWWGDETGQMLELRAELQSGHARIPTALGSSLEESNGLVRSNSWLAAFVYGIPTILFSSITDVVSIGRTVTFLLSLGLCVLMFVVMRRMSVSVPLALLTILILVSSLSFFYASHAARLDVAVAISVILFAVYLSMRYEAFKKGEWTPSAKWCFIYGSLALLSATLSIHLLTLIGILSLFMIVQFRIWQDTRLLGSAIAGVITTAILLLGGYILSGASLTLFSASAGPNQFQSVASGLPILRPFSRSVQIANILERINGLWAEAPAILIVAIVTVIIVLVTKRREPKSYRSIFLGSATIALLIAWLFFQSPALYYFVHILPIALIWFAIIVSERIRPNAIIVVIASIVVGGLGILDTVLAEPLASQIARDNTNAITKCVTRMEGNSPIVLAQNPAIAQVEHGSSVRLMTAHFLDFPIRDESPAAALKRAGVQYIMLYAPHDGKIYSSDYATLRPIADSIGVVRERITGTLFDAGRDYFAAPTLTMAPPPDTLILYELAR